MKPDIFLSYAAEDRATFVDPLAHALRQLGVFVWYDQFAIRPGDSVLSSIDRGLAEAKSGALVLSRSFFDKKWAHYELRGLVSRSVESGTRLIPIWLGLSRADIAAISPPLADISALQATDCTPLSIAVAITEVVRPDIFEALQRKAAYDAIIASAEKKSISLDKIIPGPRRRELLGDDLFARIEVLQMCLYEVYPVPLSQWHDNFCRDMSPEREVVWWEKATSAYLRSISVGASPKERQEIFGLVFKFFMGATKDLKEILSNAILSPAQKKSILKAIGMGVSEVELLGIGLD